MQAPAGILRALLRVLLVRRQESECTRGPDIARGLVFSVLIAEGGPVWLTPLELPCHLVGIRSDPCTPIQSIHPLHLLIGEFEVEDVGVLGYSVFVH